MIQTAFDERPDLCAHRLGLERAKADVRLARANRFQDVYLLYQPFTFQNNEPFGSKSSTSWAAGMTIPLPIYNRNQGNIQRSRLNMDQSQVELTAWLPAGDHRSRKRRARVHHHAIGLQSFEQNMLAKADKMRKDSYILFTEGELDVVTYLNAEREYNDYVRMYIESLLRHRRAMLTLNTVVGRKALALS